MNTLNKDNYTCPECSTHLLKGHYESGTCAFGHKLELNGEPIYNPLIIEGIVETYEDDIYERIHSQHDQCGEYGCLDAGGGVVSEEDIDYGNEQQQLEARELYAEDKNKYNEEYEGDQ